MDSHGHIFYDGIRLQKSLPSIDRVLICVNGVNDHLYSLLHSLCSKEFNVASVTEVAIEMIKRL